MENHFDRYQDGEKDDTSDSDLDILFRSRPLENEIFIFLGITTFCSSSLRPDDTTSTIATQVLFHFNYAGEVDIHAKLVLKGSIDDDVLPLLTDVGLCILPWYWMGYAATRIYINPGLLHSHSERALTFWNTLYDNVLLEFLFTNKLDMSFNLEIPTHLPRFVRGGRWPRAFTQSQTPLFKFNPPPLIYSTLKETSLIEVDDDGYHALCPLGGGKDSLVVWHAMKQSRGENVCLIYCTDRLYEFEECSRIQCLADLTMDPCIIVRHDFASAEFEKTARSYLQPCGHPWAALVFFDAVLVSSLLGGCKNSVALGHEKSADEGNGVFHMGREVNHQYDKSSHFITSANAYIQDFVCRKIKVYSALADMNEMQIAKIFCESPSLRQFHSHFISCNESVRVDNWTVGTRGHSSSWCGKCEKCCFVFLLFSAWLDKAEVITIFEGKDLLDDISLIPTLLSLVGASRPRARGDDSITSPTASGSTICVNSYKPFECVGTLSEVAAAAELALLRRRRRRTFSVDGEIGGEDCDVGRGLVAISDFIYRHDLARAFQQQRTRQVLNTDRVNNPLIPAGVNDDVVGEETNTERRDEDNQREAANSASSSVASILAKWGLM